MAQFVYLPEPINESGKKFIAVRTDANAAPRTFLTQIEVNEILSIRTPETPYPTEQRRKLMWAINNAEESLLEAREVAFQRDLGSIPIGSSELASVRKALAEFDSAHSQPKVSAEAIWNL